MAAGRFCSASVAWCRPSELDERRKALLGRSRTTGWIELDHILGNFAERHLTSFSESQARLLEDVMEHSNDSLLRWLAGQAAVPEDLRRNEVMVMLLRYVNRDHPALKPA